MILNNTFTRVVSFALAAFPALCWADFSDTGNLYIGGQGLLVGSVTIQGESFSVGGATIAVRSGRLGIGTTSPAVSLDVNGSSRVGVDSQILGQEIIVGSMTIQGNSFSVGGTTLTVTSGRVGMGTSSPAAPLHVVGSVVADSMTLTGTSNFNITTSSGIRVLNGGVKLDGGAFIQWADGSVSTTANAGGGSSASTLASSATIVPQFTVTATALGVCNSTVTMTTENSYVDVILSAAAGNSVQDASACGFLVDGGYIDGFSSTNVAGFCISQGGGNFPCNVSFHWTTANKLSAGSHSFCLTCATGGSGTSTIGDTLTGQTALTSFKAKEIQ